MSTLKVDGIRSNSATSDAISLAANGTCTVNITNNLSNRNLIINGAFQIAQRGTSATSSGIGTVDRFAQIHSATDEAPTQAQVDVASGTTPFTLGFKKAFKITNGNQTSVGNDDYIWIQTKLESQDIADSGWNYVSTSSYITLSFWVKSSVPQDFKAYLRTRDGTQMMYPFNTGTLTADTWTKITKTIPGNSSLQFDNDANEGLQLNIGCFWGTGLSSNSTSENSWATWNSAARTPDVTSTWYTTNDATFEITGVQLEVSDYATDFEHRTFHDELHRCFRYYYEIAKREAESIIGDSLNYDTNDHCTLRFPVEMRKEPDFICSNFSNAFRIYGTTGGRNVSTLTVNTGVGSTKAIMIECSGGTSGSQSFVRVYNANSGVYATIAADAEL